MIRYLIAVASILTVPETSFAVQTDGYFFNQSNANDDVGSRNLSPIGTSPTFGPCPDAPFTSEICAIGSGAGVFSTVQPGTNLYAGISTISFWFDATPEDLSGNHVMLSDANMGVGSGCDQSLDINFSSSTFGISNQPAWEYGGGDLGRGSCGNVQGRPQGFIALSPVSANVWHMYTLTNDGTYATVYIDGVLQFTNASPGADPSRCTDFLGQAGDVYVTGAMRDVYVDNTAFTAAQVCSLYTAQGGVASSCGAQTTSDVYFNGVSGYNDEAIIEGVLDGSGYTLIVFDLGQAQLSGANYNVYIYANDVCKTAPAHWELYAYSGNSLLPGRTFSGYFSGTPAHGTRVTDIDEYNPIIAGVSYELSASCHATGAQYFQMGATAGGIFELPTFGEGLATTPINAVEYTGKPQVCIADSPSACVNLVSVTTNSASARFTVTGPAAFSGAGTSLVEPKEPPGTYSITYDPVSNYLAPPPQTMTLAAGGDINFVGDYAIPGIDLSASSGTVPSSTDWGAINTAFTPQYVIARACGGGKSCMPPATAQMILRSIPSTMQVQKAAYTVLNYTVPGAEQIEQAEQSICGASKPLCGDGSPLRELAFLAVDVEPYAGETFPTSEITNQTIYDAVQAIQKLGLKAIIYTRQQDNGVDYWTAIAGDTKSFGCLPLWDAAPNGLLNLNPAANLPYGGWTERAGKQYCTPGPEVAQFCPQLNGEYPVDLDVFDPSYLLPGTTWGMADDVTSAIKEIPTDLTLTGVPQQWEQTITISNPNDTAIPGPVLFVLDPLPGGFTLQNPTGKTNCTYPNGSVYVNVSSAGIAPQQTLPPITLYFTGPSSGSPAPSPYTPRVLSGSGAP